MGELLLEKLRVRVRNEGKQEDSDACTVDCVLAQFGSTKGIERNSSYSPGSIIVLNYLHRGAYFRTATPGYYNTMAQCALVTATTNCEEVLMQTRRYAYLQGCVVDESSLFFSFSFKAPTTGISWVACVCSCWRWVSFSLCSLQVLPVVKDYYSGSGNSFFDEWDFYGNWDNLTNGALFLRR
jgi:hypothetical protein